MEEEDEDESGWTEFNSIDTAALLYYYIYYYYYTNYDYDYDSFKGAVAGGEGVELYEELVSAGIDEGANLWVDVKRSSWHLWLHV